MREEITNATILITGASDGLGKEAARQLAARGARLILHGRNEAKLQSVVDVIRAEFPGARIDTILADFSSLAQVRAMAETLNARYEHLDVLVNNAGVLPLRRLKSADGFELTFAVNYLAPFLLTNLLLPLLKRSAPARIVNLSSIAHHLVVVSPLQIESIPGFVGWIVYARTKLLLTTFTLALARRLEGSGVTCNALHPGIIPGTNVTRVMWLRFQTTREEGAQTIVNCCLNPELAKVTGEYISIDRIARANPQALSLRFQETLWKKSLAWCGLDENGQSEFAVQSGNPAS
jgi:NAD(P)-dependent dehydrogenase (short-subunit alcohol dehydrogenase family)